MSIIRRLIFRTIDHINNYLGGTNEHVKFSVKDIIEDTTLGKYRAVLPDFVTPIRSCPDHINRPPYAINGGKETIPIDPDIKNAVNIEKMKDSCRLARYVLNSTGDMIGVGITTDELDEYAHNLIVSNNAYPSPLLYEDFPKSICTSVNNVVCHGVPDKRSLRDGDIVTVDVTVYLNGFHGDCAATFPVGNVDDRGKQLMQAAEEVLMSAIAFCKPHESFQNLGKFVNRRTRYHGFYIIPCVTGHGIGSYFHGPPDVHHTDEFNPVTMEPGMTFTIEPAICQTSTDALLLDDGITVATEDDARVAQFEHTVLITDRGVQILTE